MLVDRIIIGQYNGIDFGKKKIKAVNVRAVSTTGGVLQIRLDNINSPVIAEIKIPGNDKWSNIKASLPGIKPGVHNLFISLKDDKKVEVDWISFE